MSRSTFLRLVLCPLMAAAGLTLPAYSAERKPDPRLTERVTLSEPEIRLDHLLDQLGQSTKVSYRYDPEARAQWVAIFCKDRPLREVHQALGNLLSWGWVRVGEGDQTLYRLTRDVRYRALEAQELQKREAEFAAHVERMLGAATLGPDQMREMQTRYPLIAHHLEQPTSLPFLRAYSGVPRETLAFVLAGESIKLPFASLPSSVQTHVRELVQSFDRRGGFGDGSIYGLREIREITLSLRRLKTGQPDALGLTYRFADGSSLNMWGAPFAYSEETRRLSPDQHQAAIRELVKAHPELNNVVGSPRTSRERRPEEPERGIGVALQRLHERTGLALIADVYPNDPQYRMVRGSQVNLDGVPVWTALDRIQRAFRYQWRPEEEWYLLRYRDWAWAARAASSTPQARPSTPPGRREPTLRAR